MRFLIAEGDSMGLVESCSKAENITWEQKTVHAVGETTTTTQVTAPTPQDKRKEKKKNYKKIPGVHFT